MKISFVVPVYNAEPYLQKCVDTMLASIESPNTCEIILVDDGSTDGSVALAQQLQQEHPEIQLYTQKNQGSSVARNTGIDHVTGDYIWFIDSDDYLDVEEAKKAYKVIEKNRKLDLIGIQLRVQENNKSWIDQSQVHVQHNQILSGKQAIFGGYNPASACAFIYKASFIKVNCLSFLVGISHQDVQFTVRAVTLAQGVMFTEYTPYLYIKHPGSVSKAVSRDRHYFYVIGDLYVAISIKEFSKNIKDKELSNHIERWTNSVLANLVLGLYRSSNPLVNDEFKQQVISEMKDKGMFPLKGKCLSWKQTLLARVCNLIYS